MAEKVHCIDRSSAIQYFEDVDEVATVAVFPDGRRMATNSSGGMVRIWDLKTGNMLIELEGRGAAMNDMALSRDGEMIASSDDEGYVVAWRVNRDPHGSESWRELTPAFRSHPSSNKACPLDFSPDGGILAIGSDYTTKLWNTETWTLDKKSFQYSGSVTCVRYSPIQVDNRLAIATNQNCIYIWNPDNNEKKRIELENTRVVAVSSVSLVWKPDGTHLLSGGHNDTIIRGWDSSTWEPVHDLDIWKGRTDYHWHLAINRDGTVVASPTTNNRVRLWRLSDRKTVAIFQHDDLPCCVTFSVDGKHVLAGGRDTKKISVWAVPTHAWPKNTAANDQATHQAQHLGAKAQESNSNAQGFESKIFDMSAVVRNACISGDLATAEQLLTEEIDASGNNHHSYANRSAVRARKTDWDGALKDATKSLKIQSSLIGSISKGIALCGKGEIQDAMSAFDFPFTSANGDSYLILMIKAIALFNANQFEEAMRLIQELASIHPDSDAARAVKAYPHVRQGNNALDPSEAADQFTTAIDTGALLSNLVIDAKYEDLVVLFGRDLNSSWQTANQKRCHALLRAGKFAEVSEAYQHMVNMSNNEALKTSCLNWTIGFIQEWSTLRGHAPDADATPDDENGTD